MTITTNKKENVTKIFFPNSFDDLDKQDIDLNNLIKKSNRCHKSKFYCGKSFLGIGFFKPRFRYKLYFENQDGQVIEFSDIKSYKEIIAYLKGFLLSESLYF